MNSWSDYEKFLKPIHLKGAEIILTITRLTEEDTHPRPGETVKAPVLWFKELPFGLIVSPTNRQTLIALYGDKVSDCLGKPIAVKALPMKVGGKDKQPIRIQRKRPAAPSLDLATGEIVQPVSSAVTSAPVEEAAGAESSPRPGDEGEGEKSELDAFFGTAKITASSQPLTTNNQLPTTNYQLPTTEAAFTAWLKDHGYNGKETREALATDAKSWLKANPGTTWADVAQKVQAHMTKGAQP